MATNPYQSPRTTSQVERSSVPDATEENRRGRGPVAMFFLGGFLGGIVAAGCGAVGAALLGLAFAVVHPERFVRDDVEHPGKTEDERPLVVLFGAFVGSELGFLSGAFLGAVLGVVAGSSHSGRRRSLQRWTVFGSVASGLLAGSFGGMMLGLPAGVVESNSAVWIPIGATLGASAGAVGGWILGRLLASFCWGRK